MHYQELQYDSYDEYLNGIEWKKIKNIFYYSGVPYRCRICHTRKKLLVHKRSYAYLTPYSFLLLRKKREKMFFKILVYLCHPCNEKVHFTKTHEKVPLDYLFLWEQEQSIYWQPGMMIRRFFNDLLFLFRKYFRKNR